MKLEEGRNICIYHVNCFDGFASAMIVHLALAGNVILQPANYDGGPKLDTFEKDDTVYIVDYSFPLLDLIALSYRVKKVVVMDHHDTAIRRIEADLAWMLEDDVDVKTVLRPNLELVFDRTRSGCGIVHNYFHPGEELPWFWAAIQDRDLWQFKLPYTREIVQALGTVPFDINAWYEMLFMRTKDVVVSIGETVLAVQEQQIKWHLDVCSSQIDILGYTVPCINAPKYLISEIGSRLAKDHPFVVLWFDTDGWKEFSLRSNKETGIDVLKIAEHFGGGGHKNAAGFKVYYEANSIDNILVDHQLKFRKLG